MSLDEIEILDIAYKNKSKFSRDVKTDIYTYY